MSTIVTTVNTKSLHSQPDVSNTTQPTLSTSASTSSPSLRIRRHRIPVPAATEEYRRWQLEHMAGAFRVFAKLGFASGCSGHVSLRDPVHPDTFWINPYGIHFGMLSISDLVRVDHERNRLEGGEWPLNASAFHIHSQILKARPDINAACHMHSPYGRAWSAFGKPIEMLDQDSCMFYNDLTVYTGVGGVRRAKEEGIRIAHELGPTSKNMILQNHGLLTSGVTIGEAAAYFIALERACHNQMIVDNMASTSGLSKTFIDDEEATALKSTFSANVMYMQFKPEYELVLKECGGEFLE